MKTIKNKIVYEENINNIHGKAEAIVFPDTLQEIKTIVKAHENIIARGAGTSLSGAVIPKDSIIIDLSKMNKIIEINPLKKTVVLEPGVLLSELNEELEKHNLQFPIESIFSGVETIGGMIAKNTSGSRELKYGKMMNWVDSLEVITGKGEQIKISKSDLSDFVGMEGITGIIIMASIRVTTLKPKSMSILKTDNIPALFEVNKKLRLNHDVCSIDVINKEISSLLGLENRYHLFVEFENNEGFFKGQDYLNFLKLKNKAYTKIAGESYYYIENTKIFSESIQDFLFYLEENKIPYFGHLASGVIYFLFKPEENSKKEMALKFVKRLRGKVSYNFGIGLVKKDFLEKNELEIIRRVKGRHDPHWKMSPNKVIDVKFKDEAKLHKAKLNLEKTLNPEEETKNQEKKQIDELIAEIDKKNEEAEELRKIALQASKQVIVPLKQENEELSNEEKEKIKKIAFGFFGGTKK